MATIGESLPPEILDYLNGLKTQLPPVSSAASPNAAKAAAQAVVDAASKSPVTGSGAADSAAVFEDAGLIPGKSAASSAEAIDAAYPQGAPGVAVDRQLVPLGERGLVPTAEVAAPSAEKGAAIAMGQGAGDQLPAVIGERGLAPIASGAGEGAGVAMGDVITDALGTVAKGAGRVAGPLGLAATALDGPESATKSPMDGPVPGHPGYSFKGQDIVKDKPEYDSPIGPPDPVAGVTPPADDKKDTAPVPVSGAPAAAATPEVAKASAAVDASKSKLDPILAQYLKDKQDLADAQEESKKNRFAAELGGAGATLAHAMAGAKGDADLAPFKQMSDNANQPVQNVMDRQSAALKGMQGMQAAYQTKALAEESDPNSETSKRTQAVYGPMLKSFGMNPNTVQGLSASDIKTTMEKPIEFSAKLQELKEAAALRHQQAAYMHDDKLRHEDEVEGATIANKANFLSASSRSAVGQAANAKMKLQRLNELLTDPNATPQDMNIAANDLAGAVSGGNATVSGTHGQEYKNLASDLISKANYLMGTTIPAEQSAAKQHMLDVSKRIGSVSDSVIDQNMSIVKSGHAGWFSRHPDQAQNIVSSVATQGAAPSAPGAPASPGARPQAPTPPVAPAPPGYVNIRDPKGNVRHIPEAAKAAALANGGTLVQ